MKLMDLFSRKKKIKKERVFKKINLYVISYDFILTQKMKNILELAKIKCIEIEVDKLNNEEKKELMDKGIDNFPCLDADGELIKGIDIKKINKVFGLKLKRRFNLKELIGYSQI